MAKDAQKKLAFNLYTQGEHTLKDVAQLTGVSYRTVRNWADKGDWNDIIQSKTITRAQLLQDTYSQLAALNNTINTDGGGIPDSKQASVKAVLIKEIEALSKTPLHIYLGVLTEFTTWIFKNHPTYVKDITPRIDEFITALNLKD